MLLWYLPVLTRTPVLLDYAPTIMTTFNLDYHFKGHISKYSHPGCYVDVQHMISGDGGGNNLVHNSDFITHFSNFSLGMAGNSGGWHQGLFLEE